MKRRKTRKRSLIKEYKKILYANKKTKKSYCELNIGIILSNNGMLPSQELIQKLQKMYNRCYLTHDNNDILLIARIKAVATCSKDDTFDEKKGKTVAYSKAQMKAYDLAKRVYSEVSLYHAIKNAEYNEYWMSMVAYFNREVSFLKRM